MIPALGRLKPENCCELEDRQNYLRELQDSAGYYETLSQKTKGRGWRDGSADENHLSLQGPRFDFQHTQWFISIHNSSCRS